MSRHAGSSCFPAVPRVAERLLPKWSDWLENGRSSYERANDLSIRRPGFDWLPVGVLFAKCGQPQQSESGLARVRVGAEDDEVRHE